MHQKLNIGRYLMESLWNSPDKVDMIRLIAQWTVAISGIIALVFTMRSATLKDHRDAARTKADSAERALLQTKIQTAEDEAKLAKSEAAEARAKIQPPMLSEKQSQILHSELIASSRLGKQSGIPIVVAAKMMDEESINYGKQIHDALNNTGWEIGFTPMSTHVFQGIAIFFSPGTKQSESCKVVQNAFTKAGIKINTEYMDIKSTPIQVENAVYIIIGHK
jgi:hypothetical protein